MYNLKFEIFHDYTTFILFEISKNLLSNVCYVKYLELCRITITSTPWGCNWPLKTVYSDVMQPINKVVKVGNMWWTKILKWAFGSQTIRSFAPRDSLLPLTNEGSSAPFYLSSFFIDIFWVLTYRPNNYKCQFLENRTCK